MSLLKHIDAGKTFEDIRNIIHNNNNVLYESDEYLNAVARSAINLDTRLLDYLLTFDIDWQVENVFCYSMSTMSCLYLNYNEYQRERIITVFYKLQSLIDISSDNITKCFEFILSKGNMLLLQLFIETGYLDNRDIPECEATLYYRLKYFKELRTRQ